jgi:hypothetical protein
MVTRVMFELLLLEFAVQLVDFLPHQSFLGTQDHIQLKTMKEARTRLQGGSLAAQTTTSNQQVTLEELAELTLEKFWRQESRKINQMLHRIMGNRRLVILNGEIIGVAEVNRTQRRRY